MSAKHFKSLIEFPKNPFSVCQNGQTANSHFMLRALLTRSWLVHHSHCDNKEPKNLVVFGSAQTGKSSICNMLTGTTERDVGDDFHDMPFQAINYQTNAVIHGKKYCVVDTCGLNSGYKASVNNTEAIALLIRTIVTLKNGVSLILTTHPTGIVNEIDLKNYKLMKLLFGNVPRVLVITKADFKDQKWERDAKEFYISNGEKSFQFDDIAFSRLGDTKPYNPNYKKTKESLSGIIDKWAGENVGPYDDMGILCTTIAICNVFAANFGLVDNIWFDHQHPIWKIIDSLIPNAALQEIGKTLGIEPSEAGRKLVQYANEVARGIKSGGDWVGTRSSDFIEWLNTPAPKKK